MRPPKERLIRLLELAAQGETARSTLAHEISGILLDWPPEYSDCAKLPFEALLEKSLRELDHDTRVVIAARFSQRADASIDIVNELFFAASAIMKGDIIARNTCVDCYEAPSPDFDERALLDAARSGQVHLLAIVAHLFRVGRATAEAILDDVSGQSLAVACKGAHAGRAVFSALAVLCDKSRAAESSYLRLASYDEVPLSAAERILASWRTNVAVDSNANEIAA
jgi:hypothetical protein